MADDAAAALHRAVAGLEYPSESDAPFNLVTWNPAAGEPTAETVVALTGKRKGKAATSVPVGDFFAALAETDDAARFKALEGEMNKHLTDLRVFRVGGGPKVEIYVLGKAAGGEWLGLHTTSVET